MQTRVEVSSPITGELLRRCSDGDNEAYDALFTTVYAELRRRAHLLGRRGDATLSTTALVHETYIKLAGSRLHPNDRLHFFAIAARAMRQVLLNAAREGNRQKRGGGWHPTTLDSGIAINENDHVDMLALDEALTALGSRDARLGQVVELHFFAGLDFAEVGALIGTSERTAKRDWRAARALLQLRLQEMP